MSKTLVSLCMIVKNEEGCLARALVNWRQLADELIIVDTGSTDRTIEIAAEHGATVLQYEWSYPGNKGAARMTGIDAAQGEWIVVLDADEIIRDPAGLRNWLHSPAAQEITGANVLFENYVDGLLTLCWYQVRVFRRGLYAYIHREHELPHWRGQGDACEVHLDAVFEHRTPPGRDGGKSQPMLDRLLLDVEEHPSDPGPLFFLHRQYLLRGDYQAALEWGHLYLSVSEGINPCECYGHMATAHYFLGDPQEALRWLHKAAAEESHRRIWWIRLAEMHMTQGRWQIALAHLRLASELWPEFEWQWEPETYGPQLHYLIDKCQRALQSLYHTH